VSFGIQFFLSIPIAILHIQKHPLAPGFHHPGK